MALQRSGSSGLNVKGEPPARRSVGGIQCLPRSALL